MKLPSEITPKEFIENYRRQPELWYEAVAETCLLNNISIDRFEPFTDGSNLIALVTSDCVVKIFPPFHRHQWNSEYKVLSHLNGKVQITLPELIASGERDDQWTYVILSMLPGVILEDVWGQCSLAEKEILLETIGSMMRAVHKVPVGSLSALEPDWQLFIHQQLNTFAGRHQRFGMPEWFISEVETFVDEAIPLLPSITESVILTGEYTPFNIMVEGNSGHRTISGMIDFGDAMVGYHEYDLLGPVMFLGEGNPHLIKSLLRGYGYSDAQMDQNLRRRLMLLQILHRYSNFKFQLRIPGWQERVRSIIELEELIWPLK